MRVHMRRNARASERARYFGELQDARDGLVLASEHEGLEVDERAEGHEELRERNCCEGDYCV